jgi:SAM-dependent methyltransferase
VTEERGPVVEEPGYGVDESGAGLEEVWGPGFMSPGGSAEVARVVGGADLTGMKVLDVGCGVGGPGAALVVDHGAARVVGVDVQPDLLDLARERARAAGLSEHLSYEVIQAGGPIPFEDDTFDAVFSKDAIIHVTDKRALYEEMLRVVKPGGLLLVSDWLRGGGEELDDHVRAFVDAAGHAFVMVTLDDLARLVHEVGFTDIETEDRRDWYAVVARGERERMPPDERDFWDVLVDSLDIGALRPGHIRARKPDRQSR